MFRISLIIKLEITINKLRNSYSTKKNTINYNRIPIKINIEIGENTHKSISRNIIRIVSQYEDRNRY